MTPPSEPFTVKQLIAHLQSLPPVAQDATVLVYGACEDYVPIRSLDQINYDLAYTWWDDITKSNITTPCVKL